MVDLIRAPLAAKVTSLGRAEDLIAEPLQSLEWLSEAPRMSQIVIAENGFPVRFVVPDPRVFALHKIWLSLPPTRDPIKRKRDYRQGEAVASIALEYLNLSFENTDLKTLPSELMAMKTGLVERLQSRRSNRKEVPRDNLPLGFSDTDEDDPIEPTADRKR